MTGDRVTAPESFGRLIAMGRDPLPTILQVAERTQDHETRDLLIKVAGRMGDSRARPVLIRFLGAEEPNTVSEAIDALGRLGGAESLPALRRLLVRDRAAPTDSLRELQVLGAMLRCGDENVVGDVLAIADANRHYAADILTRYQPLRDALGFEGPYVEGGGTFFDMTLFFLAVEEWYRDAVLGEPRAATRVDFSQPFREAKRAAWASLVQACEEETSPTVRARAVDPTSTATDALTVISGTGHGQSLDVLAFRTEAGGRWRVHQFRFDRGPPRSAFPEDEADVGYSTVTFDASAYAGMLAGLRTILNAKLSPWWSGPGRCFMRSIDEIVVCFRGSEEPGCTPARFCGYPGSENRTEYLAPCVALEWTRRCLSTCPPLISGKADAVAKAVFSEVFRSEQPQWGSPGKDWWWVRERMVALAAALGDDALRGPLATYLGSECVDGQASLSRTAALACNALASITGRELRFAPDGSPREVREVAARYLALLEETR